MLQVENIYRNEKRSLKNEFQAPFLFMKSRINFRLQKIDPHGIPCSCSQHYRYLDH